MDAAKSVQSDPLEFNDNSRDSSSSELTRIWSERNAITNGGEEAVGRVYWARLMISMHIPEFQGV